MKKFTVRYYECYERFYEVEANSKEEAEEKLIDAINEGRENPPDQCYDADAEATEMEESCMTKKELKDKLMAGAFLVDLFNFTDGQECLIYKGNFEVSDNIIYIPDIYLNGIKTGSVLSDEEIENVLDDCYTGNDFMTECNGHEDLARELFDFVDWQHPNIQDLLDGYNDEEFEREHGFPMEELI